MDEQLADVPGYAGYQATPTGRIWDVRRGKFKKLRRSANGSLQVDIGKATCMVHDLVARAYHGHPTRRGYRVKHANGDRSDNSPDNLVWSGGSQYRNVAPVPMPTQDPILRRDLQVEYARAVRQRETITELMTT